MSTVRATLGLPSRESTAPHRRPAPPRPDLRVVPRTKRRGGVGVVVYLAGVALFASLLGLAVFQTFLVQSQSTLDQLDDRIVAEQERTEELRLQVAQLEAPDRILSVATEDLGMIPAQDVVVLPAASGAEGPAE